MGLRNTRHRYGTVAMAFHWLIAAGIVFMFFLGKYMLDLPSSDPDKFTLIQFHKSTGLTILMLSLARLGWRLVNPVPPLPGEMPAWERSAARATHFLFYILIIGIPLSGWAMVSASPLGLPTLWFGQFEWPHMSFLADLPRADRTELRGPLHDTHEWLATGAVALLVLHVAAALKHHFWNRDNVLRRMVPGMRVTEGK